MKTIISTTLLPVLPMWMLCFALGCQPQPPVPSIKIVAEDDSTKQDNTDSSSTSAAEADSATLDTDTPDTEPPLAIAGMPSTAEHTNDQDVQAETPSTDEDEDKNEGEDENETEEDEPAEPTIDIPVTWKRLSPTQEIWLDTKQKRVIVGGKVCLNAGPLEMVICPKGTKEHESIVSVNADSWQVHAALVALGSSPGVPCRWAPEYTPAWGPTIEIEMMWRDEETQKVKTIDAKKLILNTDTKKPMTTPLVFGGSYNEPQFEGEQPRYQANDGELICLANFSTSTIDLHVSKKNIDVFFEANTPLIPPLNTQIYTILKPGPVLGKPEE